MSEIQEYHTGWISPEYRTVAMHDAHYDAMMSMPKFAIASRGKPEVGTKLLLPDLWKRPEVTAAYGGRPFTGMHQLTGSCVGVAGGDVQVTLECVEIMNLGENEKFVMPYFWFNYAVSRYLAGMRGNGEGSLGSTYARGFVEYGTPGMLAGKGMPSPQSYADGWTWSKTHELTWSNLDNISQAVRNEAKTHTGTTAQVPNAEGVRDAILNGYPCTRASGVFVNPNTATVRNGALVGNHNGRGGHQESWLGYWHHPQLGELIWEQNQWGLDVYGYDPGGGPPGGCWITMETCDRMCKMQYAEVFAFSKYQGYPEQPKLYDWVNQSFWV